MIDERQPATDDRQAATQPERRGGPPAWDGAWLRRLALSLAAAVAVGALAFLAARSVGGLLLFVQQQQLLGEVASALQGGVEALGQSNLRELRRELERIDAGYERASLLVGFGAAACAAVAVYLWLERRAERR